MKIRKTIRKKLRSEDENVQVAGGLDAVISANVGESGSESRVRSSQRIVQRSGQRSTVESTESGGEEGPAKQEEARELPDREGTYDELREEATRKQAGEEPAEGGPDG